MKALVRDAYGSSEVLRVEDVPVPSVGGRDVLVRVAAASLNASDAEYLRGDALVRLAGPFRPRRRILGSDVAGVIEAVGPGVARFAIGDEVVGDSMASDRFGALAELAVLPETALVRKPAAVSFDAASTLPQAAVLALQALRSGRQLRPGDRVVVNGAGGGVGTFAVQLARASGAHVIAVDAPAKLERLRALGADEVIDFTTEDPTKTAPVDRIIDVVARRSVLGWRRALRPGGSYLVIGGTAARILEVATVGTVASFAGSRKTRLLLARLGETSELESSLALVGDGTISPVIDRAVGLGDTADAMRDLMTGQVFGKIVVRP